jgi:hypothetical protein
MPAITIKKEEYTRLKKLDKSFGKLFDYFVYLYDIAEARKQIKGKKTITQEKLFKQLGL